MKKYVVVVWVIDNNGEEDFDSFTFTDKGFAEYNAGYLTKSLLECPHAVKHFSVHIVEVEA